MFLKNLFQRQQAATVPSMDGALRPNDALDQAKTLREVAAPDTLVPTPSGVLFSCGPEVFQLSGDAVHQFDAPVTALASSPQGALAVGVDQQGIHILGGPHDGQVFEELSGQPAHCVTALAFENENVVFVCIGSTQNCAADWQRDLLETRSSGSLWRIDLTSGKATKIAGKLGFPNGVLCRENDIIVSESWGHRVLQFTRTGKNGYQKTVPLFDLPGYPGRLSSTGTGGAWLAVFAPRSQLIEFVLREHSYRRDMLANLAPEHWIAPTLRSGLSFSEPMQGGAVKVHGIYKPWAPSRSYGLLIELDENLAPVRSFHSRADGTRHGITSAVQHGDQVIFASRGNHAICSIQTEAAQPETS